METKEIVPFSATWMDLDMITLSEASQRKTNHTDTTYMWNLKEWCKQSSLQHRNRLVDKESKQPYGYTKGESSGGC